MRPDRLIFLAAALLLGLAYGRDRLDQWVEVTVLPPLVAETSAEVLARDGTLLRAYTVADGRWRLQVTPESVDPAFIAMLIAYEDKRFYSHSGVDWRAMTRAVGQAAWHGEVVSGGSTLTMQVARLLEDGTTGRWAGKVRQIRVALALERRLTKEQILTLYVNRAPYGGNLEGIRAATRAYFGKEPRRLTPAEAALLVALPQSPETRRPDRHPDRAEAARARVLSRMEGAGVLDTDTVIAALRDPVPVIREPFPTVTPHLADRMRVEFPLRSVHQLTIDATLQTKLQTLAAEVLEAQSARLSIAMLVADHHSGEILASIGSGAYRDDNREGFIDMTRALRSPGSTLKPLIYGLAFEQGLAHPETMIEDRPTAFGTYLPQNFDGEFRGTIRVADALQQSLNIPAVSLLDALGPSRLMQRMRAAGMKPELPVGQPGLAVGLGGVGVTLEDLVTLYAGIANDGQTRPLSALPDGAASVARVLSPEAAWQVGHILSGIAPPVGAPANRLAYKTGTSYGHRDAWAVGFDGQHVIGVWLGRPDGTSVPGVFGGDLAAPVLFEAFSRLKPALEPLPAPPPSTLLVGASALPQPLRQFRARGAVFDQPDGAPEVAFPPDGAELLAEGPLTLRVRDGIAPFTWLVNGAPVEVASYDRELQLPLSGPGFLRLSVIDARGQSAQAEVSLR